MSTPIEDYAFLSNCEGAALVSREGSIDWLCLPRFDDEACFAALLGTPAHGRWLIAPQSPTAKIERRYRGDTLILETTFRGATGAARLLDFMPLNGSPPSVVRILEGVEGAVPMRMELVYRLETGKIVPWVRRIDGDLVATAGPQSLRLECAIELRGAGLTTVGDFTLAAGQRVPFVLTAFPSHRPAPPRIDPVAALADCRQWWEEWIGRCRCTGSYREAVVRSLLTLKGLTYRPTGAIVAAPTTSLPEQLGGPRNWDYRFCWVRDATFVLYALTAAGYGAEATAFRDWLLRAVAGKASQVQTVYGVAGERRLTEFEADWLPGYEGSRPVRMGNLAYRQLQIDVFGEIMDVLHFSRRAGLDLLPEAWNLQRLLIEHLEGIWPQPDQSIWEMRGPPRDYTYSKIMCWVAFDRAVKAIERFNLDGPLDRWREVRRTIREEIVARGFNAELNSFVQYYGGRELDASLLIIPLVGFLPAHDPRVAGTVRAIDAQLMRDGFALRYNTESTADGLDSDEGAFLLCSFWLADNWILQGEIARGREIFERLLAVRNDLGLLAEEYDPRRRRMLGNFPQAISHVALLNTAYNLMQAEGPSQRRAKA